MITDNNINFISEIFHINNSSDIKIDLLKCTPEYYLDNSFVEVFRTFDCYPNSNFSLINLSEFYLLNQF